MLNNFGSYGGMGGFGGYPDMYSAAQDIQQNFQGYNPYGGYNPYQGFQGFGGQGYNPWQGFDYQSFFNQMKPYMPQQDYGWSQQSPQQGIQAAPERTAQIAPASGSISALAISPPYIGTSAPVRQQTQTQVPQFGNIGQRLDKGQTITRQAEGKLNKMGYSDNQIVQANQGGTGMANFQKNLGAMRPENNSMVSPNTMRAGSNNIGRGPRMA